jgi:predicted phosphodiesterase
MEAHMPLPNLRFAVFTDLHIGSDASGGWHNRRLTDDPAATVRATVAAVNAEAVDFTVVLGDLAEDGSAAELRAARAVLDGLAMPWLACRGNHDVPPDDDRAVFERVLGEHAALGGILPSAQLPLPAGVTTVVFDADWNEEGDQWRVFVPEAQVAEVLAALEAARPDVLLVFCHFPLVRQSQHVKLHNGKNAGTLWDGPRLLRVLAEHCEMLLCFAGHQHFHHIERSATWLHCTTASLVEYPAEYRVVTIGPDSIQIETRCGAPQVVAAAPAPEVTWVAGEVDDRALAWSKLASPSWVWMLDSPSQGMATTSRIFYDLPSAEEWIARHQATGTLIEYAVMFGVHASATAPDGQTIQADSDKPVLVPSYSSSQASLRYEHGRRMN